MLECLYGRNFIYEMVFIKRFNGFRKVRGFYIYFVQNEVKVMLFLFRVYFFFVNNYVRFNINGQNNGLGNE